MGWSIALGILAYQVAHGRLSLLDQQVASWIAAWRSTGLDGLMRRATFFGSSPWTLVGLASLLWLIWRRRGLTASGILVGAFVVGGALEVILRLAVSHWRPDTIAIPAPMNPIIRFDLAGFPSGHAFRSAFVFGWVVRELVGLKSFWAAIGRWGCFLLIGMVGISRVYLNRHWISDVLGAWLVVLVAFAIARVWEQIPETHR